MGIGLPKYVRPNSTPPERDRRRLRRGAGLKCDNGASGTGARKVLIYPIIEQQSWSPR